MTINASLTSAIQLDKKVIQDLEKSLKEKYKTDTVNLTTHIDPEVIGGVKLVINSVEYDATIRGKLANLRSQLMASL
jgi:F-type H+-transporting ATPase subunit delta